MPLGKLTDPEPSFMLLGRIKKGAPKGENSIGKDLDHWRFVFKPGRDAERVEACIRQVYGNEPKDINIRLAFDTIEENWDANLECYRNGVLVAKCAMTEERGYYWLNYRDGGNVLVRDGKPVGEDGVEFIKKPIDPTQPIYYTKSKNEPVYMEPYGRLRVVIPELAMLEPPVIGWFEVTLKSPKDIRQVSGELKAIALKAKQANSDLFGIPMCLSRIEEQITKNINGNLSRGDSWMVHIALSGQWGSKALEYIERKSLPEWVDGDVVELDHDNEPSWDFENVESEDVEPPIEEDIKNEPKKSKATPHPDSELIDPMGEWAVSYAAKEWNIEKSNAAQEIGKKKFGKNMAKTDFIEFVKEQPF